MPLYFLSLQDPHVRNLESRFALQQKIVEAAKRLANETELCKTVKKKRRRNFEDAMKTLQQIENEINDYRVKTGKKPTQRASLIIGTSFFFFSFSFKGMKKEQITWVTLFLVVYCLCIDNIGLIDYSCSDCFSVLQKKKKVFSSFMWPKPVLITSLFQTKQTEVFVSS